VRPLNERERAITHESPWIWDGDTIGQVTSSNAATASTQAATTFTFDNIFAPDAHTDELFDIVAKPIVDAAVQGVNGTIFAYGQTSSGKTYAVLFEKKKKKKKSR
jgi:centromeric protein E